jgi:hypothetical protein
MKLELHLLVQHLSLFITHFHFNRDEDVIVGDIRSTIRHLKPTTMRFGIRKRLLAFKSVRLSDRDFYLIFTLFGGDATGGEGGDVTLSDNVDMLTPLTTSTHLVVGGDKNALLRLSIFSARR